MQNPWGALPTCSPFVLECDREHLRRSDSSHLALDMLPGPFNGARDAAVVLLMLNPGAGRLDEAPGDYLEQCRAKLTFASRTPFISLDDAFATTPGAIYWRKRLRLLMDRVGIEKLRRELLCLQYFPYQSKTYRNLREPWPSQVFTFELLREASAQGVSS